MALHLALTRPDVFGKAAVVSPSVWWDDRVMLKRIEALKTRPKVKMWVDMGTAEGERGLDDATALSRALQTRGWRLGEDLAYFVHHGAGHNEDAWAQRSPAMLMFLFGGR
jgi:predicted alpha/beta superfamily hydrolase